MSGLTRLQAANADAAVVSGQIGSYINSLIESQGSGDDDAAVDAEAAKLETTVSGLRSLLPPAPPPPAPAPQA